MFSLHDGTLCSKKRDQIKVYGESCHGSFKRSKQGDQTQGTVEKKTTLFYQRSESERAKSRQHDVQLHLDIKAKAETFEDHKTYLDLELNLSSSSSSNMKTIMKKDESSKGEDLIITPSKKGKSSGLSRSPSWLAFEGDEDNNNNNKKKKQEMVTTVCMKCHMLVMLCKSTLVCPNCKFMHPDDHTSTIPFKPLSLFKLSC